MDWAANCCDDVTLHRDAQSSSRLRNDSPRMSSTPNPASTVRPRISLRMLVFVFPLLASVGAMFASQRATKFEHHQREFRLRDACECELHAVLTIRKRFGEARLLHCLVKPLRYPKGLSTSSLVSQPSPTGIAIRGSKVYVDGEHVEVLYVPSILLYNPATNSIEQFALSAPPEGATLKDILATNEWKEEVQSRFCTIAHRYRSRSDAGVDRD
jgi:hypothetical protein